MSTESKTDPIVQTSNTPTVQYPVPPHLDGESDAVLHQSKKAKFSFLMNPNRRTPQYPIRSDLDYEYADIPIQPHKIKDFSQGTQAGYTGDGPLNEGIVGIISGGSRVLSNEQIKYVKKKRGKHFFTQLTYMTKGATDEALKKQTVDKNVNNRHNVILHGKELVLSPEQTKVFDRIFPEIEKIGQRK